MYRDGQIVHGYLGDDRQLYLDKGRTINPGKHVCVFEARIFLKAAQGKDLISITKVVRGQYDHKPVKSPPGCVIQGLPEPDPQPTATE